MSIAATKIWVKRKIMRTLAVVNQKGGCGKTTIAVNLAACLAACGERVLLMDTDPQGHASISLGIEPDELDLTTFNVLTDDEEDAAPVSAILVEAGDNLWLAPSNILLSAIEQQLAGKKQRESRLRNCLAKVSDSYDFCVIDCPPSVGILTMNALCAAQVALIPIDMSQLSLHGIEKLLETINVLCSRTAHYIRPRIVASMYDPRTRISQHLFSTLRRDFGESFCAAKIHRTVRLAEATMQGLPIRKYLPYSGAHEDFTDLALEIATDPDLFRIPAPFPARVLFSYMDPTAHEVIVAGDFNNWDPSERFKLVNKEGQWRLSVPLTPGKYRYRFIVDGRWREDPANPIQEIGEFGEKNSVIEVDRKSP